MTKKGLHLQTIIDYSDRHYSLALCKRKPITLVCTYEPKPPPANGEFDFTCRNTYSNTTNFNFPYQSCDMVQVCVGDDGTLAFNVYAGASGLVDQQIELVGLPIREFKGHTGQQISVQFGNGRSAQLSLSAYTGSNVVATPQYSMNLAGGAGARTFHGQDSGALRWLGGVGWVGDIPLSVDHTIHSLSYHIGQVTDVGDLVVPKSVIVTPAVSHQGQIAEAHIAIPVTLQGFNIHTGTDTTASISKEVIFDFGGNSGVDVSTHLQPTSTITANAHTGSYADVTINRYTILTGFDAYKGTIASLTLESSVRLPITLATDITVYTGQTVTTGLNLASQLRWANAYTGAYVGFELNLTPAVPLQDAIVPTGASAELTNLSKTLTIKRVENVRFGQQVEFLGIEELVETRPPKPRIYTGEYLPLVHLRTEIQYTDLPLFHSGCEVTAELEVKPAPSFEVDAYAGQDIWVTVDRLKGVILRPYNITSSSWFNVEMDNTSTIFGMCKRCEPLVGCTFEIMFDHYESYLWETSANIATKVDIDLATHSRLYFNAYAGQYAESRLFDRYLPLDGAEMYYGQTMRHNTLLYPKSFVFDDTADIPDADSTNIDLTETNARPFLNWATTGQYFDPMLGATPHIRMKAHSGQIMEFDLINWVFPNMYHGYDFEWTIATTISLEFTAHHGSGMVYYEPPEPIPMYHGQSVEVRIQIDYGVDFDEIGCVSNEYIKFLENGDPDYENSTPHAIEFERFEYAIKGICY